MKIEVSTPTNPAYRTRTVTITLESFEDAQGLLHLASCWGSDDKCSQEALVEPVQRQLNEMLKLARVYES